MGQHREQRDALMALANELNAHRIKLLSTINSINISVAALVNEAEKHLTAAVDEAEDTKGKALQRTLEYRPIGTETTTGMAKLNDAVAVAATMRPSKRNCGTCGKPGHRRQNCPDADRALKAKKARAPLSEDRKKKLREQLVKARAARKGKK
jgi:NADH pyrophosphatase NudC (nudix superfamily)